MAKFLKNTLSNPLYLREGRVVVKPGATILDNEDPREFSVQWAVDREWLVEADKESKGGNEATGVEIEIAKPMEGMTEAELKEELQKEKPKSGATGTALGVKTEVVEPAENLEDAGSKSGPGRRSKAN